MGLTHPQPLNIPNTPLLCWPVTAIQAPLTR